MGFLDGLRDVNINGEADWSFKWRVLSSHSVCFDMKVENGAVLDINNGRIQEACYVQLESTNWSNRDVHFEDSILRVEPPVTPNTASNGTPYLNWTVDGVDLQTSLVGLWSNYSKVASAHGVQQRRL